MKKQNFQLFLLLVLLTLITPTVYATHLRGGEIRAEKANGPLLNYKILLFIYTDSDSTVGGGIIKFGDGTEIEISSNTGSIIKKDLQGNTIANVFEFTHTFSSAGSYTISYEVLGRNTGVLNMANANNTGFYIESQIIIDPFIGFNKQPIFTQYPTDRAVSGKSFFHNMGAYDPDGDSLSFQLIVPKQGKEQMVDEYTFPNNQVHYGNSDYNAANEAMTGQPTFGIDAISGQLTWDAPGNSGEYIIAIKVEEWRKIESNWISLGHTIRDMQIIVEASENTRPDFTVPSDTCIVPGALLTADIITRDLDGHPVFFTTTSETFNLAETPASFETDDQNSNGTNFLSFRWQTSCDNARNNGYKVFIKAKDVPPIVEGPGLARFSTWNIAVAGAPDGVTAKVYNIGEVTLNWSDYICNIAKNITIHRKSGSIIDPIEECFAGIPVNFGYVEIGTASRQKNSFLDNNEGLGLDPGTTYCYRLVAIFEDNVGGESYASEAVCIQPGEAALITGIDVPDDLSKLEDFIQVYPNPAGSKVNIAINLPEFQALELRLTDMQGRVYQHQQLLLQNNQLQLSADSLLPGVYMVQIKTQNGLVSKKIIIQ